MGNFILRLFRFFFKKFKGKAALHGTPSFDVIRKLQLLYFDFNFILRSVLFFIFSFQKQA